MNKYIKRGISTILAIGLVIVLLNFVSITGEAVNENNPDKVIENLYNAIEKAEQRGEYRCCINPTCTMCYLGHWKFEKGTCYCDDAIKEGRDEDVCPECKKGVEENICNSIKEENGK